MSCDTCATPFTVGCLVYPDENPYVTFVRMHPRGHQRLYAGKIVARGVDGYRIRTPGAATHFVKFHRIRCAEPRVFNEIIRVQCRKKHLDYVNIFDTEYCDYGLFQTPREYIEQFEEGERLRLLWERELDDAIDARVAAAAAAAAEEEEERLAAAAIAAAEEKEARTTPPPPVCIRRVPFRWGEIN